MVQCSNSPSALPMPVASQHRLGPARVPRWGLGWVMFVRHYHRLRRARHSTGSIHLIFPRPMLCRTAMLQIVRRARPRRRHPLRNHHRLLYASPSCHSSRHSIAQLASLLCEEIFRRRVGRGRTPGARMAVHRGSYNAWGKTCWSAMWDDVDMVATYILQLRLGRVPSRIVYAISSCISSTLAHPIPRPRSSLSHHPISNVGQTWTDVDVSLRICPRRDFALSFSLSLIVISLLLRSTSFRPLGLLFVTAPD